MFSAISRLGSFKAAATELNLSPSALSHQIRALEEELGIELFKRGGRGIVLSPAAARYAETVNDLFDRMRRATADIARLVEEEELRPLGRGATEDLAAGVGWLYW